MIILDTNVISEPLKAKPHPGVVTWLDAQAFETLFLTTITVAEIRFGIAALPEGNRKLTLNDGFEGELLPLFAGRILSFDEPTSAAYAEIRAACRANGTPIGDFDALIAAVARCHQFIVATRDTSPFLAAEIPVINPFEL